MYIRKIGLWIYEIKVGRIAGNKGKVLIFNLVEL